jgi:hypothetical protein
MKNGTSPTQRAKFINGLRDLANFLGAHIGFPVPDYTALIHVFPDGNTDAERRAGVDRFAAILGATPTEKNGHYWAECPFGPVIYSVVAIDDAARADRDTDTPDQAPDLDNAA